jgi:uncharacterized membrane protein
MTNSNKNKNIVAASYYAGVLPKASELEKYNKIIPNGAERIMVMAEKQQAHRHELEKNYVKQSNNQAWIGLIFGFVITLAFLIFSVYLIVQGFGTSGTILGSINIVALVSLFVYGTKRKR